MKYYWDLIKAILMLALFFAVCGFTAGIVWSVLNISFSFANQLLS